MSDRGRRYVDWLGRHHRAIIVAHVGALAAALWLIAVRLPLHADLTDLLPEDSASVVGLRALEARVSANDPVLAVIQAPDPATRAMVADELAATIRALPPWLVTRVDGDRADARAFLWNHRFLLAPLAELRRVRDALRHHIDAAKLAANPIYVDLDDREATPDHELDDLRAKSRELEQDLGRPSNVSKDGRVAVLEVRTAMAATNVERGEPLLAVLGAIRDRELARHPGISIGFAGDLVTAIAEHDAIVSGIVVSGLATAILVGLVLAIYFRSFRLLVLLAGTLSLATVVAFGVAAITVGHLNAATAFLGSIIAGNGINYGILMIARFLQERRTRACEDALAVAIEGTLRPTIVASLGAAVAYSALGAASFKGFSEFAIIGSVGMLLCWVASFVLLPAVVLRHARDARAVTSDRWLDLALVRGLGFRRRGVVLVVVGATAIASIVVAVKFLAADPFEYDMRRLGSVSDASETERHWMAISDAAVGKGRAGRTIIAAQRADQVPLIVDALEAPERRSAISSVVSILSVVPTRQPEKLALLAEIREMLDGADDELSADDRARFTPPATSRPIDRTMLPRSIVELLSERSEQVGLLVSLRPAAGLDELDGHDMIRFARAVDHLELANHEVVTTSGASVIFADILETIGRDGPRVVLVVIVGLIVMLVIAVGLNRRTAAVLAATGAGALLMVATCALLDLRVTFLDLVALPVTLGLGVDYAINVAHRAEDDPIAMLRHCASAVFVCSLTTMIGYGSLLVSDNLAIRGFGRASLVGEITTVISALVLVPALLAGHRTSATSATYVR